MSTSLPDRKKCTTLEKLVLESINEFCSYEDFRTARNIFRRCCEAAVSDQYIWSESPMTLISFYERLEKSIILLHQFWNNIKRKNLRGNNKIFSELFGNRPLSYWVQMNSCWKEAGLSKYSVLDIISITDVLAYCYQLEDLLEYMYSKTGELSLID